MAEIDRSGAIHTLSVSGSSCSLSTLKLVKLELDNNRHTLHDQDNRDVDEDHKHALGNEEALDFVTHIFKSHVAINDCLVLTAKLTIVI